MLLRIWSEVQEVLFAKGEAEAEAGERKGFVIIQFLIY